MAGNQRTGIDWRRFEHLLARVRKPIETARTLPPACYTDEEIFARERETIFRKSWIGIGRSDRWRDSGDYATLDVAGVPVIVLRDDKGELRAYANTCRHRGAKLLAGQGNCRTIRCPYHAWTYTLDGRLLLAPRMDKTPNFDASQHGLVEVRLAVRDGFTFVCLDDQVVPLDEWLGDFSQVHEPWTLNYLVSTRRQEFEVACNWKAFLEVFNEYYHLPIVHPDSINDRYDLPDDADDVTGHYASQFGSTQGSSALLEHTQDHRLPLIKSLAGRNRHGTRYTWLYPNMTFAAGTEAVWVLEAYPVTPNQTQVSMTTCFPQDTIAVKDFDTHVNHYYERFDAAMAEDLPTLENQQEGLRSPLARQGRFSHLEPSVANFACWYAERVLS